MSDHLLDKGYEPHDVERRWYGFWEENRLFAAEEQSDRPGYSIVIPPPNVTGVLHMGHALNNTLQDILVPLPPPVRGQRAVDARHRPRRDRHPERGRAQAGPGRHGPARPRPRALHRRGVDVARGLRQRDHQPAQAARRLLRLGARALHHGRGPLARRAQGLRGALPRGADLPRATTSSTGAPAATRRWPISRSSTRRSTATSTTCATRSRAGRGRHHRRHHPARDHAGRHGRGREPRGRALPGAAGDRGRACRSRGARSRSSATATWT